MSKNTTLVLITIVAALGGLLFGYDTGVINGTQFYFSKYFELDPAMKGWVVGSALLGCLVGAIAAAPLAQYLGRKYTLVMAALLFTVSAAGSGMPFFLPQEVSLLVFFRIVGGLGIGLASMAAPTYIAEIAPAKRRGVLVSFYQLAIVTGFFVVFLATYFIGSGFTEAQNVNEGWRWMFWSELIPCALFLLLTFFIPRSPRWLVLRGRDADAELVLARLHTSETAEQELLDIKRSIQQEADKRARSASVWQKAALPIVLIGTVLSVLQQFTGINAVLYYGGDIFEKALGYGQEDVLQQQILLGAVNFLFTFVAMFTVDRFGRKPLIYLGSLGMLLGFSLLGGSLYLDRVGLVSLIGVLLFIGSFALSMGPVVWVMLSEMFPNNIRSVAMSIAVAAQWAANYLVSQSFPIIAESDANLHGVWNRSLPYVIFGVCIIGIIWFTHRYLVETKGKSLEELEGVWAEKYGRIKG